MSPANGSSGQGEGVDGQELVLKVLGAIGAGIGVLGFVTLFGGAIVWLRAEEAGLPANEAVAVVPSAVLVTTGASFLVPALLLALLVVVAIAAVHLVVALLDRRKAQDVSSEASDLRKQADQAKLLVEPEERRAAATRARAQSLRESHQLAVAGGAEAAVLDPLDAQASQCEQEAELAESTAAQVRANADSLDAEAQRAEAARQLALERKPALNSRQRLLEYAAALVILTVLPLAIDGPSSEIGLERSILLVVVAIAVALVSAVVYVVTQRFLWLGVVAFLSVGVYTGFVAYFRTASHLKLEPVALLRTSRSPLVGFFVAENSENVYIGTFKTAIGSTRLLVVPREQVTAMAIGPLLEPKQARQRALTLVQQICAQTAGSAQGQANKPQPVCDQRQLVALSAT